MCVCVCVCVCLKNLLGSERRTGENPEKEKEKKRAKSQ